MGPLICERICESFEGQPEGSLLLDKVVQPSFSSLVN